MTAVIFNAWGDWVVLAVLVLMVFGVVMALYTRSGSEIESHPRDEQRLR